MLDIDSRIERVPISGCWIWTGYVSSSGYGQITYQRKTYRAHRLVYSLMIGEIPEGKQLDHLCRNRCCVNPNHLEPVTHRENILRGIAPTAENGRKTHCDNGHPLTDDNLTKKTSQRECKQCKAEAANRHRLTHIEDYRRRSREWIRAKRAAAKSAE